METTGINKDYILERALTAYDRIDANILYHISMAVGKTRIALSIAHKVFEAKKNCKILFIASTVIARDKTIVDELHKWDMVHLTRVMEIVQYEALDDIKDQVFDLVIFDEAHNITPRRYSFFGKNHCSRVIGLTGTLPDDANKKMLLFLLFRDNVIKYSMIDSMYNRTVNKIHLNIIYIDMSPEEETEYNRLKGELDKAASKMKKVGDWILFKARGAISTFINNSESKQHLCEHIIAQLRENNRRFIVFTNSKEQANRLSPYRYYSGISDADLNRFTDGEINELASIKMLKESVTIPNLLYAVIAGLNSKTHNLEQMAGRLLRGQEYDIGKLYVPVLTGTADTHWVKDASKGIPEYMKSYFNYHRDTGEMEQLYKTNK